MIDAINFNKMNGLIPAVIQDADGGRVLMVGFMNREALERTITDKQVTFWSRTKSRLWKKGETTGNVLNVVSISTDCDNDSVLIQVRPTGPVCHTGEPSCFSGQRDRSRIDILQKLESVIRERKASMPEGSYTSKLFREGVAKIAQKVGEEAVELAIAAQHADRQRVIEETADMLYHTLVLLAEKEVKLNEVCDELEKRGG